jgi:hypothetical protein
MEQKEPNLKDLSFSVKIDPDNHSNDMIIINEPGKEEIFVNAVIFNENQVRQIDELLAEIDKENSYVPQSKSAKKSFIKKMFGLNK